MISKMGYTFTMTSSRPTKAFSKAEKLPDADQDRSAHDLGRYGDNLTDLRRKLDNGVRSLDAGLGKALDIEAVIAKARATFVP